MGRSEILLFVFAIHVERRLTEVIRLLSHASSVAEESEAIKALQGLREVAYDVAEACKGGE